MLSHQKLKVYGKGLAVVASLAKHSAAWDKRHAGAKGNWMRSRDNRALNC